MRLLTLLHPVAHSSFRCWSSALSLHSAVFALASVIPLSFPALKCGWQRSVPVWRVVPHLLPPSCLLCGVLVLPHLDMRFLLVAIYAVVLSSSSLYALAGAPGALCSCTPPFAALASARDKEPPSHIAAPSSLGSILARVLSGSDAFRVTNCEVSSIPLYPRPRRSRSVSGLCPHHALGPP